MCILDRKNISYTDRNTSGLRWALDAFVLLLDMSSKVETVEIYCRVVKTNGENWGSFSSNCESVYFGHCVINLKDHLQCSG